MHSQLMANSTLLVVVIVAVIFYALITTFWQFQFVTKNIINILSLCHMCNQVRINFAATSTHTHTLA